MKQKLLELLNAKFLAKGVRKDTLARLADAYALQCSTDEEAQALVDKLTDAQVTEFGKGYRSEVDSEISKAVQTALDKNKGDEDKDKKPEEEKKSDPNDLAAIIADAVAKATNPLIQEINSIKAGETSKTRLQQLNDALNDAKDEVLKSSTLKAFNRMSFEDDSKFSEYLTEVQADIQTSNQSIVNQGLRNHVPGSGAAPTGSKFSQEDYDAMFNN